MKNSTLTSIFAALFTMVTLCAASNHVQNLGTIQNEEVYEQALLIGWTLVAILGLFSLLLTFLAIRFKQRGE